MRPHQLAAVRPSLFGSRPEEEIKTVKTVKAANTRQGAKSQGHLGGKIDRFRGADTCIGSLFFYNIKMSYKVSYNGKRNGVVEPLLIHFVS